ncbi:hypothetical protein RCL1_004318 [Eukaryota sp. TZLM3-RCL]
MRLQLDDLSKYAAAINTPRNTATPSFSRRSKRRQLSELSQRLNPEDLTRDYSSELSSIRSADELIIDHSRALSIKRGDLAIIQGEVFRCTPRAPHLAHIPLVLKRLDCVDRRTYDMKVYEADTLARFQGHANIVSLYSYWTEPSSSPYVFKSLVMLMEEGILGDLETTIVRNPIRPSNQFSLKVLCDLCKGLITLHNCNIIHGKLKPTHLYLSSRGAVLGDFGKGDLDCARATHQLFSKVLIGDAIPKVLVYWAPELLKLEKYTKAVDIWALGVVLYQLVTGVHPFNTDDEASFRDDVLTANVDWSRLDAYPKIKTIVENTITVEPSERWTAHEILHFAQFDFAVSIQRVFRGYLVRRKFKKIVDSAVKIQAAIRGWLGYTKFWRERARIREEAVLKIQKVFRGSRVRREYTAVVDAVKKVQANVLARQTRRAFFAYKCKVVLIQKYIRGFICRKWLRKVLSKKAQLTARMTNIDQLIGSTRSEADDLARLFPHNRVPPCLSHLTSFEAFELHLSEQNSQASLPTLCSATLRLTQYEKELDMMKRKLKEYEEKARLEQVKESELEAQLGLKYVEYRPMVEELRSNLVRVAKMCQTAKFLGLGIQHPYVYSKWDMVHEPWNVVENILKDDEQVYRALSPVLDLTLSEGKQSFVSEIQLFSGECGPSRVEIYVGQNFDDWEFVAEFECNRDSLQLIRLPGEQICRHVRISCPQNIRGGNIVSVRHVKVKGLVRE